MVTKKEPKNAQKYICIECNFTCSKKSNYEAHLLTAKHKMITNDNKKNAEKNAEKIIHKCPNCPKIYKFASGLSRHMKVCSPVIQEPIVSNTEMIDLIKQNQEVVDLLVEEKKKNQEERKKNEELQNQLIEVAKEGKTINNTHHNTHNTQNTQFNLNVFLNEDCKDAVNLIDFIQNLKLSLKDLESMGQLGYVNGMQRIFTNALNDMDVTERPIHCTDIKRETVYVKDKDKWELETGDKSKLKATLHRIEEKNLDLIPKWQKENPNCEIMDSRENEEYINMTLSSLGPDNEREKDKQENKIIKSVLKEVTVDKSMNHKKVAS
tara:strand:- start:518 stop:1483 length:966 start_codon:yes stop_codon:yes gene_type:complete